MLLFQIVAFSQETNLDSFHSCGATVFETEQEGIRGALSYLSPTRSECRNGLAVLAIEKFLKRVQNQAVYKITDTLSVQTKCPENCIYITRCSDKDDLTKQYILLINTQVILGETFTEFKKAWTYNDKLKFIETSKKELTCVNDDYGA